MAKQKTTPENEIAKKRRYVDPIQGGGPSHQELKLGLDKAYGKAGPIIIAMDKEGKNYKEIIDCLHKEGYSLPRGQFLPQHIARYLSVAKALEQ